MIDLDWKPFVIDLDWTSFFVGLTFGALVIVAAIVTLMAYAVGADSNRGNWDH